jgi:hypothetical protein
MEIRVLLQQALTICAISCFGMFGSAIPAKASSMCSEVLATLVSAIDSELEKIPYGPVDRLENYVRSRLPIANCSLGEFRKSFERSRFLDEVFESKTSHTAVLINKTVAVVISLNKSSSIIEEFTASVRH